MHQSVPLLWWNLGSTTDQPGIADGTRISMLEDAVQKLRETTDRQQQLLTKLVNKLASMAVSMSNFFKNFTKIQKEPQDIPQEFDMIMGWMGESNQGWWGWSFLVLMEAIQQVDFLSRTVLFIPSNPPKSKNKLRLLPFRRKGLAVVQRNGSNRSHQWLARTYTSYSYKIWSKCLWWSN